MNKEEAKTRFSMLGSPAPLSHNAFGQDVQEGLSAKPKRLSCKYFYDAEGSRLFEEICTLPEYYPTRAEASILSARAPELVQLMGSAPELVELGSGSAEKTRILIKAFLRAHGSLTYRPIDISVDALRASSAALLEAHAGLRIEALAMEYQAALEAMGAEGQAQADRLLLWLGSSIGNYSREDAAEFLGQLRSELGPRDCMLVGLDLRKGKQELEAAYDDSRGVTAAFNKNLLRRINDNLGANFDLQAFEHEARYLVEEGRIEMWLISKTATKVSIKDLQLELSFEAGEGIHTESSLKYSPEEIECLASAAGFSIQKQWFDAKQRFCDVLLRPN